MENKGRRFFLVREDLLPESIVKTIKVKEILLKYEECTVNKAVTKVGLSRSAFYKYKDGVFPFHQWNSSRTVTLALVLEHRSGILSHVLNTLAGVKANIFTINQNIPIHGLAGVTITFETKDMKSNIEETTDRLKALDGVREAYPVGHNFK
jgi:chorismate mutase